MLGEAPEADFRAEVKDYMEMAVPGEGRGEGERGNCIFDTPNGQP